MAYAKILFENPRTGQRRIAPVGFSWTTLIFSFFPPLFRSDWKWAAIQLLCSFLTGNLSALVFMFIYNRLYVRDLIADGYVATQSFGRSLGEISLRYGFPIPGNDRRSL